MSFKIGNINIKNNLVLAPMAGISNPTYIKICESMGAGYAITELISAEAIVRGNKKTLDMLEGIDKIKMPVAIQIFGSNPATMKEAAKILVNDYHAKIIDINMGCPVPKVAIKSEAGSALLKDVNKIRKIVREVVNAIDVPVTVKIRSGWDNNHINAIEVAKVIEESGASAITIHARTRSQGYSGKADWKIIKDVVNAVNIPVIGNGDIYSPEDAKKMLDETGCTAVMIGRGALGNPWIFKNTLNYLQNGTYSEVTILDKIDMMKYHYEELLKVKNEHVANLEMRTILLYYLKGIPNTKELKSKIITSSNYNEIKEILDNYLNKMSNSKNIQLTAV